MRKILPVVSVLGLLGAGAVVSWSVFSRQEEAFVTGEAASAFNMQTGPAPVRAPAPLAAGETLRDSVAAAPPPASSMMRPIAVDGMAVGGLPPRAAEKRYTVISSRAETWAKRHKFFAGLIAKPASFLLGRSSLGSARELRSFLADAKKVDAYMNSSLVRVTLNSPTVAKALLGNGEVIRAFLASPAMRDPQAVRALLSSPMFKKMIDCPAIQEAVGDPDVMQKMLTDPKTIAWVAAHPQALTAISTALPALADAFSSRAR